MPKIVITEQDLTTPGSIADNFDVVYVPGLVDTSAIRSNCTPLAHRSPKLFTDVDTFEAFCGTKPVKFAKAPTYADIQGKFPDSAIPYDNSFFGTDNAYDPSYIFAKELIAAGLPVMYERLNPEPKYTLIEGTNAPTGWDKDYTKYYVKVPKNLAAPGEDPVHSFIQLSGKSAPTFSSSTYYSEDVETLTASMKKITYTGNYLSKADIIATKYYTDNTGATELELRNIVCGETAYVKKEEGGTATFISVTIPEYYTVTSNGFSSTPINNFSELLDSKQYTSLTIVNYPSTEWEIGSLYYTEVSGEYKTNIAKAVYTVLTSAPSNWASSFRNYYMKDTEYVLNTNSTYTDKTFYKLEVGLDLSSVYSQLSEVFDSSDEYGISDKGNYSIKYLTSGGYPTYEYNSGALVTSMLSVAADPSKDGNGGGRGDCIAFIDHTDNIDRSIKLSETDCLYKNFVDAGGSSAVNYANGSFGTMFTPWATYTRTTTDHDPDGSVVSESESIKTFRAPGSFAYLLALAKSLKTNAPWLAVAGAARGSIPNLAENGMTTVIPNGIADKLQPRRNGTAINAVTEIKPYGNVIWGNRTLHRVGDDLVASDFLNIRNMICDIKKICYRASRKLTFEQNNDVLWVNFKSLIAPTLDRMLSGYGISGYKIVRDLTHERAQQKATVCAKIIIHPVYPVEDFYISIVLKDDEITVAE